MSLETSVAFAVAVFLFAATPGPAIVACVARALPEHRRCDRD
jgi:threonine/homoserine/homoserine lactone efflux protein